DSVANIMNAAQLDNDGNSRATGIWGPLPTQTWFRAPYDGTVPPGPLNADQGFPDGKSARGRLQDNPSVALSFGIYDWLRSMGIRPSRLAVVAALRHNLREYVPGNSL